MLQKKINPEGDWKLREKGLEPLHLAVPDPKSGVSANFTIPANEPQRDRTFDPQIKSLLLYQLS